MIKSMTGYGRSEIVTESRKVTVELKAVNHRYSDLSIKMPKKINCFETNIRSILKQYIGRGKVDIFIMYEDYTENKICIKYNKELAREYIDLLVNISNDFSIPNDINATTLSKYHEVFTLEEQSIDEDELWSIIEEAVRTAVEKLVESRVIEGENLKNDIIIKLDYMNELLDSIEDRSPKLITEYREKLTNKVQELLTDNQIDEHVIITEVTIYADKICTDEEMVRLRSHISSMKNTLINGDNIGRKLDFIAQEMNREANTILSKSNDLEITNIGIDLKTEIEKVREQIQNIE
ncbi:MAG TPA: YicC family protein [Clostridiales bacterium]|nr:YicC family protein [Clostridiales bacterium]